MGIVPLWPEDVNPQTLQLQPGDRMDVDAQPDALSPRCEVPVNVIRLDWRVDELHCTADIETQLEVELRDGGVIPSILMRTIATERALGVAG